MMPQTFMLSAMPTNTKPILRTSRPTMTQAAHNALSPTLACIQHNITTTMASIINDRASLEHFKKEVRDNKAYAGHATKKAKDALSLAMTIHHDHNIHLTALECATSAPLHLTPHDAVPTNGVPADNIQPHDGGAPATTTVLGMMMLAPHHPPLDTPFLGQGNLASGLNTGPSYHETPASRCTDPHSTTCGMWTECHDCQPTMTSSTHPAPHH